MPEFAVLRVAKISSLKGLAGAAAHNSRTASTGLAHADNRSPLMGGGTKLLAGQNDAVGAWHDRTKAVSLPQPRKDAVRALECVLSASPGWFAKAAPDERTAWVETSMAWATKTFGADNILSAHLHDDESNCHLHVLTVPLMRKSRKKAGRPRKGREGRPRASNCAWGLSAADIVGSPEKLASLQTSYAGEVANLGIRRGRPRRTTGAKHKSATAYRSELSDELLQTQKTRVEVLNELSSAKGTRMFADIESADIISSAIETADAFTTGLDAIDIGELTYNPGGHDRAPYLKRHKVEVPSLPVDQTSLRRWKKIVRPMLSRLLAYAYRLSLVSDREHQVQIRSDDLDVEAHAIQRVADRQSLALRSTGVSSGPEITDAQLILRNQLRRNSPRNRRPEER